MAQITVLKEKIVSMSEEVQQLVKEPKLENLEMAAQLLEDSLGDVLKWLLKVCPWHRSWDAEKGADNHLSSDLFQPKWYCA